MAGRSVALRRPGADAVARHQAYAEQLVPVEFVVVAGPPGCPEFVVQYMQPADAAKAIAKTEEGTDG